MIVGFCLLVYTSFRGEKSQKNALFRARAEKVIRRCAALYLNAHDAAAIIIAGIHRAMKRLLSECPACKRPNNPPAAVCSHCGCYLSVRKCPACHNVVSGVSRWCPTCGCAFRARAVKRALAVVVLLAAAAWVFRDSLPFEHLQRLRGLLKL